MELHGAGEAAAQLSDNVKGRFADVPWQQPARLRNRIRAWVLVKDLGVLHTAATRNLPGFVDDLKRALASFAGEEPG